MNANDNLLFASMLVLLGVAGGCSSMRTVDHTHEETEHAVEVGDTVRIVTHAGQRIEFEVTAIDRDTVTGVRRKKTGRVVTGYEFDPADEELPDETLRVPLDDVARLQVRELEGWKVAAVVGSTFGVLWLIESMLISFLIVAAL
jgi:hypothetical protein